jgi:hypothetical protein
MIHLKLQFVNNRLIVSGLLGNLYWYWRYIIKCTPIYTF